MKQLDLDVDQLEPAELPAALGRLVELEGRVRLRLAAAVAQAGVPGGASAAGDRTIDSDEAAAIAGTSTRWLLSATRGLAFRVDLSRKQPKFLERGLRAWLASRRRR